MYFHLIWIKEKDWKQYELDVLIKWWDEDFIRKFLWYRWVVIVSISEFKEDSKDFWNIVVLVSYEDTDIQILTTWDNLDEKIYFFISLWLSPHFVNFVINPISEQEMQEMIKLNLEKIQKEEEKIKEKKKEQDVKEQKKYSESAIDDCIKIINYEIIHIEQVLKAWESVIPFRDKKKLEDLTNEMKKIRLWTNFNKMVSLILYSHDLTKKFEEEILSQYADQKFLVDKNSVTTNIDFISEISTSNRISEKAVLQPNRLSTQESFRNLIWPNAVFLELLKKDLLNSFDQSSFDDYLKIIVEFIETIILITIIIISLLRLICPLLEIYRFSLYLLPMMGWLGLLCYLLNSLKLKWLISNFVGIVVFACIYWIWLILLKWTFSI